MHDLSETKQWAVKLTLRLAGRNTIHISQEVARALYGVRKGREGVRILSWGKGLDELSKGSLELLEAAGFKIPEEKSNHDNCCISVTYPLIGSSINWAMPGKRLSIGDNIRQHLNAIGVKVTNTSACMTDYRQQTYRSG